MSHVHVIEANGNERFLTQAEALSLIAGDDVERVAAGGWTLWLKKPRLPALRGPSCLVSGSAPGKDDDGLPRLSYLERVDGTTLEEIRIIRDRILFGALHGGAAAAKV